MGDVNHNGDRINIHERLTALETNVNAILNNHLPHIERTISKLSMKFWAIILLLMANLVGIVISTLFLLLE